MSQAERREHDDGREDEYLLEVDDPHLFPACENRQNFTQNMECLSRFGFVLGTFAIAAAALGLLSLIGAILWFTAFHPQPLKLHLHSVALQKFMVRFSFPTLSPQVNAMLKFTLSLENPNIVSFDYEDSVAYVYYYGDEFASAPLTGGTLPAKGNNSIAGTADVLADNIMRNSHFFADMKEDVFPTTLFTNISGRINVFHMFHSRVHATANCSVSFTISTLAIKKLSCVYSAYA